jgi:hypothetical protein
MDVEDRILARKDRMEYRQELSYPGYLAAGEPHERGMGTAKE